MIVPNFPYSPTSHDEAISHVEKLKIHCFQLAAILFKLIRTIYWEAIERVGMGPAGIHCAIAEATAPTVQAARAKQIHSFAQDKPSVIKPVTVQPASRQPATRQRTTISPVRRSGQSLHLTLKPPLQHCFSIH